jgi:Transmembrane secretion effector
VAASKVAAPIEACPAQTGTAALQTSISAMIASKAHKVSADGIATPLRHVTFRRIWLASLLSNLGILIQSVGAAWSMTQLTSSADKVALVQTAASSCPIPSSMLAIISAR